MAKAASDVKPVDINWNLPQETLTPIPMPIARDEQLGQPGNVGAQSNTNSGDYSLTRGYLGDVAGGPRTPIPAGPPPTLGKSPSLFGDAYRLDSAVKPNALDELLNAPWAQSYPAPIAPSQPAVTSDPNSSGFLNGASDGLSFTRDQNGWPKYDFNSPIPGAWAAQQEAAKLLNWQPTDPNAPLTVSAPYQPSQMELAWSANAQHSIDTLGLVVNVLGIVAPMAAPYGAPTTTYGGQQGDMVRGSTLGYTASEPSTFGDVPTTAGATAGAVAPATGVQSNVVAESAPGLSQIRINSQNGAAFQARVAAYGSNMLDNFMEEVSIRPFINEGGTTAPFRVRLDGLGTNTSNADYGMLDAKASETAPLTANQIVGYPLLEQYGGVVVGRAGNPYYPAGTVIPPAPVQIIRPANLPKGF